MKSRGLLVRLRETVCSTIQCYGPVISSSERGSPWIHSALYQVHSDRHLSCRLVHLAFSLPPLHFLALLREVWGLSPPRPDLRRTVLAVSGTRIMHHDHLQDSQYMDISLYRQHQLPLPKLGLTIFLALAHLFMLCHHLSSRAKYDIARILAATEIRLRRRLLPTRSNVNSAAC